MSWDFITHVDTHTENCTNCSCLAQMCDKNKGWQGEMEIYCGRFLYYM